MGRNKNSTEPLEEAKSGGNEVENLMVPIILPQISQFNELDVTLCVKENTNNLDLRIMIKLFQRLAVMSATFILLCTPAVSQSENGTKSVTTVSEGVILHHHNEVLEFGDVSCIIFSVSSGYGYPFINYGNTQNVEVETSCYSAKITDNDNGNYTITITAKDVEGEETIYINAVRKPDKFGLNGNSSRNLGASLHVKVVKKKE